MVALVTGQHGFIGAHAVRALEAAGISVRGAGRPELEIPSPAFDAILRDLAPDLVVHCAGPASVQAAELDPEADRHGSVDVLAALIERLRPDTRLLLVSSAAVYGDPRTLPIGTNAEIAPISAYGRHRAACEELALDAGAPCSLARVFSAYGEGLERQVWWDIGRRAARREPVTLFGTGRESRDFIHGADVGRALATLATRAAYEGEAYNVASGAETTIAELAERIVHTFGDDTPIEFTGAARAGDPQRWRADVSAIAALGFECHVTLDEGVDRYVAWLRTLA